MTYLVDGHNLIPKVPGLSLAQLDDEEDLIALLKSFCDLKRCQMEVFFDAGRVDGVHQLNLNRLKVHFVLPPSKADDAILLRLLGAGRAARNYTVVTSDRQVRERSLRSGAKVVSSTVFARSLTAALKSSSSVPPSNEPDDQKDEIRYWEDQFSNKSE